MNRSAAVVLVSFLACSFARAQKWEVQYLFEENDRSLTISDLKFPSARRGFAAGVITRRSSGGFFGQTEKVTPVVLLTSDGGKKWTEVPVKEAANSLFFLDETTGWLVGDSNLWMTTESGRAWKRISTIDALEQVYFLTNSHGFAVGDNKRVLETTDSGATWKPVAAAATVPTTKEWTVYSSVAFAGPDSGLITGFSRPPTNEQIPAWMRPEAAERSAQSLAIFLQTNDGGKSWKSSSQRLAGEITRSSLSEEGYGLSLLQLEGSYQWPSEVYRINLVSGGNPRIFRDRDRAITDVLLVPNGDAYVAGYEPPGKVRPSPIPGKVKILRSSDLERWTEIPVDYRVVARRVWLASPGGGDVWAATDTGVILKLQQ